MNRKLPAAEGIRQSYGIWPENSFPRSLEEAQAKLLERVMEDLPPAPARVLVFGVSPGSSGPSIDQKGGYAIVALTPSGGLFGDTRREKMEIEADIRDADFMADDLLEEASFDAVLFLETAGRFGSLDRVIARARQFLKENGSLIIAGETTYNRRYAKEMNLPTPADITVGLSENGFFVAKKENISERVKETPDHVIRMILAKNGKTISKGTDREEENTQVSGLNHWEKRKRGFVSKMLEYEIVKAKKSGFFLRAYAPDDENEILDLFKQCFYTERSVDHWNWKYKENPFGSLKIALAVDETGAIAAHYAGYPVPFYLAEDAASPSKDFMAYQNGDTMTRQKFRNVGLGRTSLLARTFTYFIAKFAEDSLSFYYGFNTDKIKILGKRYMGYNYIEPVTYRKKDLTVDSVRKPGVFRRTLGGYSLEEVKEVNEEWDDFFHRVGPSYGLLARRDSRYLRWRYLECPENIHKIFAVRKKKRLVGWSVFSFKEKTLIWGDALFDKSFLDSADFLLYDVVKSAYPGSESIEAWFPPCPEWWDRWLDRSGFCRIPEPRGLTPCAQQNVYNDRKGPSVVERKKDSFYYTMGDSDLF
jgi:hypothetical protein